jgi:hypothetical protein
MAMGSVFPLLVEESRLAKVLQLLAAQRDTTSQEHHVNYVSLEIIAKRELRIFVVLLNCAGQDLPLLSLAQTSCHAHLNPKLNKIFVAQESIYRMVFVSTVQRVQNAQEPVLQVVLLTSTLHWATVVNILVLQVRTALIHLWLLH